MATKKWLNIIVDGNSALGPYWPKIFSDYLVKIVRSFCGNSTEQGANSTCELGLVMFNSNSDLGMDVQYINWTKDVDYFLGTISSLPFNGDNQNQHAIAEGFAEALVMFPRPPNRMTIQEYYEGRRHCLLVTAGDPVPIRMLVSLPMIKEGKFVSTGLKPLNANFLEVAKMFGPLGVSLSIITPKQHQIFGEIFNMGNNDSPLVNFPIFNHRTGQFTVLLSGNFKEAHDALHEERIVDLPSKETVESIKTTTVISLPIVVAKSCQEDLSSSSSKTVREKTIEGAQDDRSVYVSPIRLVVPNATIDQTHVPFSNRSQSMNVYDDIMKELGNDEDIFLPRKKAKTCTTILEEDTLKDLFQPDHPIALDDSLGQDHTMSTKKGVSLEVLRAVEEEPRQVLRDIAAKSSSKNITSTNVLTSNSSMEVNVTILPMIAFEASTSNDGEGSSSKGLVQQKRGNKGVVNPVLTTENCLSSGLLLPQNNTNLWPSGPKSVYHPSGTRSTVVRLGIVDPRYPPPTSASFGNSMFPHATGNSLNIQSQPHSASSPSLSMFSYASSSRHQHFPRYHQHQMTGFGQIGSHGMGSSSWVPRVSLSPQINPRHFWSSPPSLTDYEDFVTSWEGSLVGKVQANRTSLNKAEASKRSTSPFTLTANWSHRLEITLYIPKKALYHTLKLCRGPIDYVFFRMIEFNNLDLYEHLTSKNQCAKIDLPFQTLILSTTESKYHYLGTIFPGDTVFVEPV